MKIACGLKEGDFLLSGDYRLRELKDDTVPEDDDQKKIDFITKFAKERGAVSCIYNEETDTVEVRFNTIGKVFQFFKALA